MGNIKDYLHMKFQYKFQQNRRTYTTAFYITQNNQLTSSTKLIQFTIHQTNSKQLPKFINKNTPSNLQKLIPERATLHMLVCNYYLHDPWEQLSHPPKTHAIFPNQLNPNKVVPPISCIKAHTFVPKKKAKNTKI